MQTKTPLPDDQHLCLLGSVTYICEWLAWAVANLVQRLDPSNTHEELANCTLKNLSSIFTRVARDHGKGEHIQLASEFTALAVTRNDVIHAFPATDAEGRQFLYRWSPKRTPEVKWINDAMLEQFIAELDSLAVRVNIALHAP